jgi:type IV secretion system protein VirB9
MTPTKRALLGSLLALPVYAAAHAEQAVRVEAYEPQKRTALVLQKGRVTNVTFSVMERIKRIVSVDPGPVSTIGKDDKNQEALINNLPLFGQSLGSTNLVVITVSPDGMERAYLFTIRVVPEIKEGEENPEATFSLSFTYPKERTPAQQQQLQQAVAWRQKQMAVKAREVADARLSADVFYGPQNFRYLAQGRFHEIAPIEASDNGRLTAFRYPGNLGHPAVFVVQDETAGIPAVCATGRSTDNDAPEQSVQSMVQGDLIVVQRTAAHFRLRTADKVVEVYNCGYDPIGQNPGTGTSSPDVVRKVVTSQ